MNRVALILLCLLIGGKAYSQCTLVPSETEGCAPLPVSFKLTLPSGKKVQKYEWDFGDDTDSKESNPTRIYQKPGLWTPSVTVYFKDGTKCTAVGTPVRIWHDPNAVIDLPKSISRCYSKRFVRMDHKSTKGADGAKLETYRWNVNNRRYDAETPFHEFGKSGSYKILLEVTDANGCIGKAEHTLDMKVYEKLDVGFVKFGKDSCPVTSIKFANRTDSSGWDVNKVTWRFGNGISLSAKKGDANWSDVWNGTEHTYSKDGISNPWLIVENTFGCVDSITRYSIDNVVFWFDVKANPDSIACFNWREGGNAVVFTNPVVANATSTLWEFGDGDKQSLGFTGYHKYQGPGSYTVKFKVRVRGCERDTTICDMIRIKGPVAKINRYPDLLNDSLVGYPFDPFPFPNRADTCQGKPVEYYTLDTFFRKSTIKTIYCNADTISKKAIGQKLTCSGPETVYEYTLQPQSIIEGVVMQIERKKHFLHPDTPVVEQVFSPYTGEHVAGNIHDTDLFAPHCSAPHTVDFTNNTIKHRLYDAVDNRPPGFHDECINPNYPYATDSLDYFWDFDDPFCKPCTSSTANPDLLCSWSTERLPKHTFSRDGCYWVKMKAYDDVTKCESWDSVLITLEPPFAAYDSVNIKVNRMDYDAQRRFGNTPYLRGMKLEGLKCVGTGQKLMLDEVRPQCAPHNFWILPDSAALTKEIPCGTDTVVEHDWLTMKDMQDRNFLYTYDTEGWKTVGLVMKSGNCYDTFWYHKYKYFYDATANFTVQPGLVCGDQTFTSQLSDTMQQGIEYVYFTYLYKYSSADVDSSVFVDTLDYLKYKTKNGNTLNITSSLHNPDSGVEDDTTFNNLSQQSHFKFNKPGHVLVVATVKHRMGCERQSIKHVSVGHFATFSTKYRTYCVGDKVEFVDSVRYFQDFRTSELGEGLNQVDYWKNPAIGRTKLPQHLERVAWDLDGDSIIDHEGPRPVFRYQKPGLYTIRMFTKDTLDCEWQMVKKENHIRIVGIDADFSIKDNDSVKFCASKSFTFLNHTTVSQPNQSPRDTVVRWVWDWGNGTTNTMSKLSSVGVINEYTKNGVYRVKMKAILGTYDSTGGAGCTDTTSLRVYVEGPKPKFEIEGETEGCVPFTATVRDRSKDVSVWQWSLGNGSIKSSFGAELVDLYYPDPGTYYITLIAGDTVVDEGDSFYCTAAFPDDPETFKVTVFPTDPLSLEHDSLLCIDEVGTFKLIDEADTAYSSFKITYGDGDEDESDDPLFRHSYGKSGKYDVTYTGTSRCPEDSTTSVDVIDILANFELDSSRLDTPVFWFKNTSQFGKEHEWSFGNERFKDNNESVSYTFVERGNQEVCLVAFNERGCSDTICKNISLETNIFIPNVFSPDGDRFNNEFIIWIKGNTQYELTIFNRWGEKVFESDDKNYRWNGRKRNNGSWCQTGTYFYVFQYQLLGEEPKKKGGTITLLR